MSRVPIRLESKSKYRNKRSNGFDSKREESRWKDLCLLQRAGKISELKSQVSFSLDVNGISVGEYIADFIYLENGQDVIEDSKGYRTREYRLKKKLMKAIYGIEIRET